MNQLYDRNLRRGQEAYGRSPRPGASAHIHESIVGEFEPSRGYAIVEGSDERKGENLPFVDMSGKLQIEKSDGVLI